MVDSLILNTQSKVKENPYGLELIRLLEKEMIVDLEAIDIKDDSSISIDIAYQWYMEAEKLIRVLANILSVPMFQAINQLRYAGHHVLKAQMGQNQQQNLIEGYKHCKRAVYDSLDFYVYKLSENYRILLPFVDNEDGNKIESLLKKHIKDINNCRVESGSRLEYYGGIQKTLIDGLDLIEQMNIILRKTGITKQLLKEKRELKDQIDQLNNHVENLKSENVRLKNNNH